MDTIVFWFAAISIAYAYVGFPVVVGLLGWLRNLTVDKKPFTPSVSMIIAAHNEAESIGRKLDNALALDYPDTLLEIVVASDGSTDETETIVREYESRGVQLLCLPRQGKIVAIEKAVASARGEILVFTDATTQLDPQAIRAMTSNFADNKVGGVCGNQRHGESADVDNCSKGERLFWRYDRWLKSLQSRTGSIVSAGGAIYAIRRKLYEMPASLSVTDDFVISTGVIDQGYRLVYEDEALAMELPTASAETEFSRKVRIINCGLRAVYLRRRLLNPFRYGLYSLILFSHKVLRRLVPFLLILLFGASIILSREGAFYYNAAVAQGLFYVLAALGYYLRGSKLGGWKVFYLPFYYCLANGAALTAVVRIVTGEKIRLWEPAR